MKLFKQLLNVFFSLRTSLWLLGFMLMLMFAGAFIMPGRQEFQLLHSMPLWGWIQKQPVEITWWLWGLIGILSLLTINTLFCSIESLVKKRKVTQWLLLISPQIIHVGFLFMLLAHLLSAVGASQAQAVAAEGTIVKLSKETNLKVDNIIIQLDYYGRVSDWKVAVAYLSDGKVLDTDMIEPNNPSDIMGFNINVKDLRSQPAEAVLLQINREPGAPWALVGSILFAVGIITLIVLRIKMEKV